MVRDLYVVSILYLYLTQILIGEKSLCCVYTVSLFDTGMSAERSLCCVYTVSLFDTVMSGKRLLCCVYTVSSDGVLFFHC